MALRRYVVRATIASALPGHSARPLLPYPEKAKKTEETIQAVEAGVVLQIRRTGYGAQQA